MTTTYYIVNNNEQVDQDSNMEALYARLLVLAEANPDKDYGILIDGPGNPAPQEAPAEQSAQPISTGTQPI